MAGQCAGTEADGRTGGRVAGWAGGGVGCLGGPGSFLVLDGFFRDLSTDSEMSVHEPASSSRTPQIQGEAKAQECVN